MNDKYCCYNHLGAHKTEEIDYRIREKSRKSRICVITPHGGQIEWGVSELVRAVARTDFSWYLFEGCQKNRNKRELHITSHRFDEPRCLKLICEHDLVLALHGQKDPKEELTYIGGRNKAARLLISDYLRQAGFKVPSKTPPRLKGEEWTNICNRYSRRFGVQLEISKSQRMKFFDGNLKNLHDRTKTTAAFDKYITALRGALMRIQNNIEQI